MEERRRGREAGVVMGEEGVVGIEGTERRVYEYDHGVDLGGYRGGLIRRLEDKYRDSHRGSWEENEDRAKLSDVTNYTEYNYQGRSNGK